MSNGIFERLPKAGKKVIPFVMELLYPLPELSGSKSASPQESTVAVLVHHTIASGLRTEFLEKLKALLAGLNQVPGAQGYQVFQEEAEAGGVRITILQRFASLENHDAWLSSPAFASWKSAVAPLEPRLERVSCYSGMAALFAAGKTPDAPPRWKMAVVLFFAVFPLSLALSHWFGQALASIPPLIGALVTSPVMVVVMTYIMVPLLTKVFAKWLQPS